MCNGASDLNGSNSEAIVQGDVGGGTCTLLLGLLVAGIAWLFE